MKKVFVLVISVLFVDLLDSSDFNIEKYIMRDFYDNNHINLSSLNKTQKTIKPTFATPLPKNAPLPQTAYKDQENGFLGSVFEGQFTLIGLLNAVYNPNKQETFSLLFIPDNRNLFRIDIFYEPRFVESFILTSDNYKNFNLQNIANILPTYKELFKKASCVTLPAIITIDNMAIQDYTETIFARLLSIQEIKSSKLLQYNISDTLMDYKDSCFQSYLEYVTTASNDMYVNVRQEPKVDSSVVARVLTKIPRDYDKKKWDYRIRDEEGNMYVPSKYFLKIQQDFLEAHPEVIDTRTWDFHIYYIGLPINGWYNVYFTDKNGKKIKGYIHKSQLKLGL